MTANQVLKLALAFFFSSSAMAQSDPTTAEIDTAGLVIEAVAGWDGTVDRSTPIPVSFLISNYSERIIEGDLTLNDPSRGREVRLGEVVVSAGATRRFTSIQAMTEWHRCFATMSDGEHVLWRRELALTTGKEFVPNANFALFIDAKGRKLQLPGELSDTAAVVAAEIVVAGEQGRPIRCLSVKPWQVPNHPGPLVVAQAIVFPEGADDTELNRVQWRAVAKWICQGGTVFIQNESRKIIDRLIESAPLGEEPPVPSGEFVVRRVGLGAILEYPQKLFSSEGSEIRNQIAKTTANLTKHHVNTFVNSGNLRQRRGGRSDLNRVLVIAFFGFYTLFSGVVSFLLFRQSQRRIAAYTVVVVVAASILSGLLGGLLRHSRGDLRWITVTQAGAGGVVQVGNIDVQSAGGRNTQVAIKGEDPDLQCIEKTRRYYPWNRRQTISPPFTWQPNLARSVDNTYQINVPMTPWGRRRLHATTFTRELRRLDFELVFEPRDPPSDKRGGQVNSPGMPSGLFTLKVVNRLPFEITACWLVIGVTHRSADPADFQQATPYEVLRSRSGSPVAVAPATNGLVDVYHMKQLPALAADANYQDAFEAEFRVMRNNWNIPGSWQGGSLMVPRISRLGTASAWLIGHIEKSPIMEIDEPRSEFVPQEQFHIFVQEILAEEMPDASLFLNGGKPEAVEALEHGTH